MSRRTIAIVATLDTKRGEAEELARLVQATGFEARLLDVGLDAEPGLRSRGDRAAAMSAMGAAGASRLRALDRAGSLAGVLAVGGNQGTAIAAMAMRELPIGLPKLIVSTVASGDVRPFVGDGDVTMLFSVGDLLGGPNPVTAPVLEQAAAAVCAMAQARAAHVPSAARPAVGLTAFGNTHRAAERILARLREAGRAVVPFHASGACGSAMERLIDDGRLSAVVDLTTHELLGELYPFDRYAPVRPGRLTAAGRHGLPQVVVPGGLEYFCFGPPDTVPPELRDRPIHHHNPFNVNVRTSAEEVEAVALLLADRLNAASGPAAVLVPLRGWSEVGSRGGALHDAAANAALVEVLRERLGERVQLRELDLEINDVAFADAAADTLLDLAGSAPQVDPQAVLIEGSA